MDTLTHALSGALLARATAPQDAPPRSMPRRIAAGFFAAAAPDLDFVLAFVSPLVYLEQHRGVTHSVLLLPLWALLLSWILAKILREPRGWRALYGITALGLGAHILGDLITSFGTIIFAPVSDARFGWGTTFIIDLWFTGIILAGLIASLAWRRTRIPAAAASLVLVAYVGFQAVLKERALDYARDYARQQGWSGVELSVMPRAVSPFNWTVYASDAVAHRFAHVNLWREEPLPAAHDFIGRLDAAFQPLAQAHWQTRTRYGASAEEQALAQSAWDSPALGFMRWFAEMPAFDGLSVGSTCVWFVD
ncbi:MAG: metal-dependent hydrolase, partial [Betaproteobacteria bacterium]|nr:metal-dependent hydrolase [Betaproteobacteria bacterium]